MRASNGWNEPRSASTDIAAAMSAARASRSAPSTASASTAVLACVPLMSASPSFGRERRPARRPARASASRRRARRGVVADGRAAPSPISTSARCASGARSPLAPTDPRDGTHGCTPALSSASSASSVSRRMPEKPFASTLARSAISARTAGTGERLADARRVAAQQIQLQRGELVGGNRDVGERAEAGVDAVHRPCRPPRGDRRPRATRARGRGARAVSPTRHARRARCARARRA